MMRLTDPYDVKASVAVTSLDALEADDVFVKALALATQVQDLHATISDRPRFSSLFDQVCRSSSSVLLNFAQGTTKLMGHTRSDYLVARSELAETYAGISLLPAEFRALKPAVKELTLQR